MKYLPETTAELQQLVRDENIKLSDIDISAITDMSHLFQDSLREDFSGIETWNVSNVTNMECMFWNAKDFNADISKWNVSNVKDMRFMFGFAKSFNGDISNWDVSNVTNMKYMFFFAKSFNGDLSKWDVSNVKNTNKMFTPSLKFYINKLFKYVKQPH